MVSVDFWIPPGKGIMVGLNAREESVMPMGMTLFVRALGDNPPVAFDPAWTGGFLSALASRVGVPAKALQKRPAPFTISPLLPAKGGRFRLRLSWLVDGDAKGLVDWAGSLKADPLRVEADNGPLLVEDAMVSSTLTQRWTRWVSYDRLYEEASDCLRLVTLKYYSPTTLQRSGHPYPLPDPCGVFLEYLRIWDIYSGVALSPSLREVIEGRLLLVDFRIQMRLSAAEHGPVPGFIGSSTFRLEGRHPESILKGLNVLADFSFFCGTGIGTDRGMGMTRRIL